MLLLDPDSWDRLSRRPDGLSPALTLKRDYQRFVENKVASENQTKKDWDTIAQRVQPIITAGVKNANQDLYQFFAGKIGNKTDVVAEKAVDFAQRIGSIAGVTFNVESDTIILDGVPLKEKGSTMILTLLRTSGRLTPAKQQLLMKLVVRGDSSLLDMIKNVLDFKQSILANYTTLNLKTSI